MHTILSNRLPALALLVASTMGPVVALAEPPGPKEDKLSLEGPVGFNIRQVGKAVVVKEVVREGKAQLNLMPAPLGGIGVVFSMHNGMGLVVRQVLPDTSAAKAGLSPGFIITQVDDVPLASLSVMESVNLLSGPPGTFARVEVVDPKKPGAPLVVHLMRQHLARVAQQPIAENPGIVVQRVPEPQFWNIKAEGQETAAQFSRADPGAADSVRKALTDANIPFLIVEGDLDRIQVSPTQTWQAREVLRKVQSKGHWSIVVSDTP